MFGFDELGAAARQVEEVLDNGAARANLQFLVLHLLARLDTL